jgi:hypothetical protein
MSVLNVKNAKRPRTLLNPGPLAFSRPAPAGLVLCSESAWESLAKGMITASGLKQFVTGLFVFVLLAGPAVAGPLEDGAAAIQRGDFAEALRLWKPLAEKGDPTAQYNLGLMYEKGDGVAKDDAEALRWFQKAAKKDFAAAQYNIGLLYENGQGVAQDNAEALKWYQLAAKQSYAPAQNNLGLMYANGRGVTRDDAKALNL